MKKHINMLSRAHTVKGQGVGSAYEEQVALVKKGLCDRFEVSENKFLFSDITHYHTVNPEFFLSIPLAKKKGTAVGYVHFLPETVETSLKMPRLFKKIFYRYILAFYKSMDYLVTVNPYFIDRLAAYGVPRERVTYIPNFVSETAFYPVSVEEKQRLREQYGISKDRFTVICAGQLQTRKGIFDYVECAKRLPDLQFVWAGGFSFGHISDGYEEIKHIVDHPPQNMKFLGIVDREKMNEIYNLGDVMFLPSFEELFPMTILEAMNCRIPILLRDIDLYENILFDFYLKEDGVEGFVQALNNLRKDGSFYEAACERAWRGHQFYNRKHVLEMWDAFYSDLVGIRNQKVGEAKKKEPLSK